METQETVGKLIATRRTTYGKGTARKLRAQGLIPAVCYGPGVDPLALTVSPLQLQRALDPGKRKNTLIDLLIQDGQESIELKVMLKDYQIDPLQRNVIHADFVRVALDQEVEVEVPFVLEGRAEGVKLGGVLHQVFRALPVRCTPGAIPNNITADVTPMQVGDVMRVSDLSLPEGITIGYAANQTVAHILSEKKAAAATVAEEEGAATAAEGAAKEGGAAAAE